MTAVSPQGWDVRCYPVVCISGHFPDRFIRFLPHNHPIWEVNR